MFRRDLFVLLAVALIGATLTVYLAIGQAPFFPKSLQSTVSECPARTISRDWTDEAHRSPILEEWDAQAAADVLRGFLEQPLVANKDHPYLAVRLMVSGGDSPPFMVRLVETQSGMRLIGKRSPRADGCRDDRGCVSERTLTDTEEDHVRSGVAPLMQTASYGCRYIVDAPHWLVEISGRGEYRLWSLWAPRNGDQARLSRIMMNLTGWWPEAPMPPA